MGVETRRDLQKCFRARRTAHLLLIVIFAAAVVPARAQPQTSGADANAWALIHDTSDTQILDRFIAAWPASPLTALAQARKRELAARADAGQSVQSNPPATAGETFIGGLRKGVAAAPGTTILRVTPAKPAQDALRLSQECVELDNRISSGGSNGYSAPRVVGVKPVPGDAKQGQVQSPIRSSAPIPVLGLL